MQNKQRSAVRRQRAVWIGMSLLVVFFVATGAVCQRLGWQEDYSKWSSSAVFQMSFGKPPPSGVTDITASGRHYVTKKWVWLRFQATDHALHQLDLSSISNTEGQQDLKQSFVGNRTYNEVDLAHVGWGDVDRIAHPVYYELSHGSTADWLWGGVVVVDPTTHTVFVQAHGD